MYILTGLMALLHDSGVIDGTRYVYIIIYIYKSVIADLLAMRSRPIKREIYARILF